MKPDFITKSFVVRSNKDFQITFFCDLCANSFTSNIDSVSKEEEALEIAKKEARIFFNHCKNCNSWVCDEHFNEFRMMCTSCAPRICQSCGIILEKKNQFCTKCGKGME